MVLGLRLVDFDDPIDRDDPANIDTVIITEPAVTFPVLQTDGRFGSVTVRLEPGESELVTFHTGKRIWVKRLHVH